MCFSGVWSEGPVTVLVKTPRCEADSEYKRQRASRGRPLFCEDGIWYHVNLRAGQMVYLPMHWWHQVRHAGLCCNSGPHPSLLTPVVFPFG